MAELIKPVAEWCALLVEAIGIAIIVAFAVYTVLVGLWRITVHSGEHRVFKELRHLLGRGILLGLEFLMAADIIHTVAVELTFQTVGVLALVVLVRTFLSFTLEVEITGHWPWSPDRPDRDAEM
jgi:uncharacterized membrane protein